jgi:hypothetical protein
MGSTPPWLVSRMLSFIVAVIGAVPLFGALLKGGGPRHHGHRPVRGVGDRPVVLPDDRQGYFPLAPLSNRWNM